MIDKYKSIQKRVLFDVLGLIISNTRDEDKCVDTMAECLIRSGLNLSLEYEDGNNVLHIAACYKDPWMVACLLACEALKDKVNVCNEDGDTPLMMAIKRGNREVIQRLLKAEHLDVYTKNQQGENALHVAIRHANDLELAFLLSHEKISELINEENNLKETPLMLAVSKDREEAVNCLLNYKAFDIKALEIAITQKKTACEKAILDRYPYAWVQVGLGIFSGQGLEATATMMGRQFTALSGSKKPVLSQDMQESVSDIERAPSEEGPTDYKPEILVSL